MIKIIKKVILILIILSLAGCDNIENVEGSVEMNNNISNKENVDKKLNINYRNKKILDFLDDEKNNIVFSNTGIESVIEMVRLAAKDDTKDEIENVFGVFDKNLDSEAVKIYNYILLNEKVNDKIKPKESYMNEITKKDNWLKSDVYLLNEKNTSDIVASKINKKVEEVTDGFLKNVTDKTRYENKDLAAELSNTIYFNDKWSEGIIKENDYYAFENNDKTIVTVEYLIPEGKKYLIENEDLIGFTLPYKSENERYHFIGVMPKNNKKIEDCSFDDLDFYKGLYVLAVDFPIFDIENDIDLLPLLKNLGINKMFDVREADLTNGFEFDKNNYNLCITKGGQKTKISVNNEGTMAAAYTYLQANLLGALFDDDEKVKVRGIYLRFNKPFYYMVYDTKENTPIFYGKVNCLENVDENEYKNEGRPQIMDSIYEEYFEMGMHEKYIDGKEVVDKFFKE